MEKRQMAFDLNTDGKQELVNSWSVLSQILKTPENDAELDQLIEFSDYLMDNMTPENNLGTLLNLVGDLIAEYESEHIEEPHAAPIDSLRFLMDQHGLKQKDLVEIGSPGVISEVMNGKRELNKRQIGALAKRFSCSPAVFF